MKMFDSAMTTKAIYATGRSALVACLYDTESYYAVIGLSHAYPALLGVRRVLYGRHYVKDDINV